MMEEYYDPVAAEEPKSNTTKIIIIVAVAVVLCACVCLCVTIGVPALLGPSIGNVFSEINSGLTP